MRFSRSAPRALLLALVVTAGIAVFGSGVADAAAVPVLSPTTVSLTGVTVGSVVTTPVTLTNTGDAAFVLDTSAFTAGGPGWTFDLGTCVSPIAPGAPACTIHIIYSPTTTAPSSSTFELTDTTAALTASLPVSATAGLAPHFVATVANPDIGLVRTGDNAATDYTITNDGGAPGGPFITVSTTGTTPSIWAPSPSVDCANLAIGASCTVHVVVTPFERGLRSGAILVSDGFATASAVLTVTGVNPHIAGAQQISFGAVRLGQSSSASLIVTSNGQDSVILGDPTIEPIGDPAGAQFSVDTSQCPSMLTIGQTCVVTVTFSPTAAGSHSQQLSLDNDGDPLLVQLDGTGGVSAIAASSLDVQTSAGTSTVGIVQVTNPGNAPLTISSHAIIGVDAPNFTVLSTLCESGPIAPGASCSYTVRFAPLSVDDFSAVLQLVTSASDDPTKILLHGGMPAAITQPPLVTVAPPALTRLQTATITWTMLTGAFSTCAVDNAAPTPCSPSLHLSALANGQHQVTITQRLPGEQTSQAVSVLWTVDRVPPKAPKIAKTPPKKGTASAHFQLVAPVGSTLRCHVVGRPFQTCGSKLTISGLRKGAHVFEARAVDAAGNVSATVRYSWKVVK